MLVPADLAEAIRVAMSFSGGVSDHLLQWATGIIGEIQTNAVLNGPVPGATSVISGMTGASMANLVVTSGPVYGISSQELLDFCGAIVDHLQIDGIVSFELGDISGTCNAPGDPIINGSASGGDIVLISGAALAQRVSDAVGYGSVSAALLAFCTAVTDYIMANAEGVYAPGNVNGECPILTNGVGNDGTIS